MIYVLLSIVVHASLIVQIGDTLGCTVRQKDDKYMAFDKSKSFSLLPGGGVVVAFFQLSFIIYFFRQQKNRIIMKKGW